MNHAIRKDSLRALRFVSISCSLWLK